MSVFFCIFDDKMRFNRTSYDRMHEFTRSNPIFEFKSIGDEIICSEIISQVFNGDIQGPCDQNDSLVGFFTQVDQVFGTGKDGIDENLVKDFFCQNLYPVLGNPFVVRIEHFIEQSSIA